MDALDVFHPESKVTKDVFWLTFKEVRRLSLQLILCKADTIISIKDAKKGNYRS